MCVAVPGKIISVGDPGPATRPAQVVYSSGDPVAVDLVMVPDAGVGDFVVVHSGYAIAKISPNQAAEVERLLSEA